MTADSRQPTADSRQPTADSADAEIADAEIVDRSRPSRVPRIGDAVAPWWRAGWPQRAVPIRQERERTIGGKMCKDVSLRFKVLRLKRNRAIPETYAASVRGKKSKLRTIARMDGRYAMPELSLLAQSD